MMAMCLEKTGNITPFKIPKNFTKEQPIKNAPPNHVHQLVRDDLVKILEKTGMKLKMLL